MGDWESIFKKSGKVFLKVHDDMREVILFLKKNKAKRILDLGCGTGRHTILLAKNGFDVYSTDISKTGLKMTKKSLKEENLSALLKRHSCYKKFPFNNNFFDAIISTQVIHHNYHNKVKFCISEIERVLKPDGIVFITFSANKSRTGSEKFVNPEPHVFISLEGGEKRVPHFIYNKTLIKKDFKNFQIIKLHKDKRNNWCILGKLRNFKLIL